MVEEVLEVGVQAVVVEELVAVRQRVDWLGRWLVRLRRGRARLEVVVSFPFPFLLALLSLVSRSEECGTIC